MVFCERFCHSNSIQIISNYTNYCMQMKNKRFFNDIFVVVFKKFSDKFISRNSNNLIEKYLYFILRLSFFCLSIFFPSTFRLRVLIHLAFHINYIYKLLLFSDKLYFNTVTLVKSLCQKKIAEISTNLLVLQ